MPTPDSDAGTVTIVEGSFSTTYSTAYALFDLNAKATINIINADFLHDYAPYGGGYVINLKKFGYNSTINIDNISTQSSYFVYSYNNSNLNKLKVNIEDGKYKYDSGNLCKDNTLGAVSDAMSIKGGYFGPSTEDADSLNELKNNCASGYTVKTLAADDPERANGYVYKVVETENYAVSAQVKDNKGKAVVKVDNTEVSEAASGDSVVFTATPNKGYEFDYWEVVNGDVDIQAIRNNNPITVTMPDRALTLKAVFKASAAPSKKPFILLTASSSGTKNIKLSWNSVPGATKYVIYGQHCGQKVKKLKTTTNTNFTVKKIGGKKLEAHKTYHFYVVAYTPNGNVKSKTIHYISATTRGKFANVKSIKAKKSKITLAPKEKKKLGAVYSVYNGKKHITKSHGRSLRFISNCPEVAKVSSSGVVTAVSPGKATIYIQDIGGRYCKTVVTVKAAN